MRQGPGWVVTLLLAALVAAAASRPGVRRADCFPLETLGVDRARESEALLLRALDSEALYTLVGGLKPVSSGFATFFPDSDGRLDLAAIARTEALLSAWHCGGEIVAGVYKFERADERGQFYADAIVGHAGATRSVRATHAAFFSPYQLAHNATPLDVVRAVEHDTPLRRWRGYGYLYGYPAYAVDFFVAAE